MPQHGAGGFRCQYGVHTALHGCKQRDLLLEWYQDHCLRVAKPAVQPLQNFQPGDRLLVRIKDADDEVRPSSDARLLQHFGKVHILSHYGEAGRFNELLNRFTKKAMT